MALGEAMRMSHEAPLDRRKFRIASAFAQVKIALVGHRRISPCLLTRQKADLLPTSPTLLPEKGFTLNPMGKKRSFSLTRQAVRRRLRLPTKGALLLRLKPLLFWVVVMERLNNF